MKLLLYFIYQIGLFMGIKKTMFGIVIGTTLVCLGTEKTSQHNQPEITFTQEELDTIKKALQNDPNPNKKILITIPTQKGFDEILACLYNNSECNHPALLDGSDPKHAEKLVEIASKMHEKKDVYEGLYDQSAVNREKRGNTFYTKVVHTTDEIVRKSTKKLFDILYGYLQYKKIFQSKIIPTIERQLK